MSTRPGTWLTSRRLRAHGILLGVALWSLYVWTMASPGLRDRNGNLKGTDFLHFYTLGSLAMAHRGGDLYSMNAQAALAAERVPPAAGIRYLPLYPPQVSILFAPLASFSYPWALALWWSFSATIYGLCCWAIWRVCPKLRGHGWLVALLATAFPAFFNLIAWGQTSALALACFTLMYLFLRDRREFLAGIALGCLIFKPQLGLAAAIVFISIGAWRIVGVAILSAAAESYAGVMYYGWAPLRTWVHTLWNVRSVVPLLEPRPYQTHCLRTFWSMLIPWEGVDFILYVVSALLVLALTISIWRRSARALPLPLRYSSLLLATVLLSPHLTVYDLVILAPAILLTSDWLLQEGAVEQRRRIGTLLYLVYVLPLLAAVTRWTHVQLSVLAMTGLIYAIWTTSHTRNPLAGIAEQE
jgi:hypothetical protein